jgi:kynurenine formamidase
MDAKVKPANIDHVLALSKEFCNWGRWGDDDERGTVNFITPAKVRESASCVQQGRVFSLAVPFDNKGPQTGLTQRFNPMLFMTRDGGDIHSGAMAELPRYAGREAYSMFTDDVWVLPSQAGTQWDGLAHCFYRGKMYNGYDSSTVSSWGAKRCGIQVWKDRIVTRGVLLDIARWRGVDWLSKGDAIEDTDLAACAKAQSVEVREGDIVLIRTGSIDMYRQQGSWGDYAGGDAPGLALSSTRWIHAKSVAGVAVDTWGAEVRPNETPDVFQPFHVVALVHMGLLLGEIFDLEELAADCAADRQFDFQFVAPPLPVTGAVGSPINPLAIK